jgi:hypothetical protein
MNLAMWSGPRNLSTAMMYSFAQRSDFEVVDEPFYGAYLAATGDDHPMAAEIIANMETDPVRIAARLANASGLYSKQMTHHLLDGFPRDWFSACRHAFLIRHPARVVASYAAKRERPTLAETGFVQQRDIFAQIEAMGQTTVVVDSFDIRANPEGKLRSLCSALGLAWDPAMLSWPKGGNPADGIWAAHWYGAVHGSTGFAAPEHEIPKLEPELQRIVDEAMPHYEALARYAI